LKYPSPPPDPERHSERAFITGVEGFVGRYLARYLSEKGEEVSGIDLEPAPRSWDWTVSRCDLLDFETLETSIKEYRPACVYHLAGLVHPRDSLSRPRDYYLTNVQGTVNLLEALRRNEIKARVLIVSSSKVYGPTPEGVERIDETQVPNPQTPYALSKYLSEQIALQYFHNYGTQVLIARPFNHTGPGQPLGFVLPDFCKQIAEIEALPPEEQGKAELQVGDLSPIRDLLDVRDVVIAYEAILKRGNVGEFYNVASGVGVPIRELLERTLNLSRLVETPEIPKETGPGGSPDLHVGDSTKLQAATGWRTSYSLEQTLRDTLDDWRNQSN